MAKNKKAKKAHKRKGGNGAAGVDEHVLDRLYLVIDSRKGADPDTSYTARLFSRGRQQIAKKLGEEAVEALIEGIRGDRREAQGGVGRARPPRGSVGHRRKGFAQAEVRSR